MPFRRASASVGQAQVLDALRPILDPWFRRGIGELGFVRDVRVRGATATCVVAVPIDGAGVDKLLADMDAAVCALDMRDGKILWRESLPGVPTAWGLAVGPQGNHIVVTLMDGRVLAFAKQ